MRHVPLRRAAVALASLLMLSACAQEPDQAVLDARTADEIFATAEAAMEAGAFADAAQAYDDLERLYPYSQLARTAMLRAAQAYYLEQDYTEARLAAERFLSFYPADPEAPQAQYLIANTYYDQIVDVGRDQGNTREALAALRETVARYPDTPQAREAQLKLDLTQDHLAGKEMQIGRYYLARDQFVAAINRFRTVIEQYQTTSHTPEALHRLVESYLSLGVIEEAQTAAAVLGYNFPGSDWYAASYDLLTGADSAPQLNDSGSWLSRVYRQVILGEWL